MLRDRNLVPLSHQHQHALALCVRIRRALEHGQPALGSWQREICNQFDQELDSHFDAEERFLFPLAQSYESMAPLVSELLPEHTVLRSYRLAATSLAMSHTDLLDFAAILSGHIHKEEQQLFEECQRVMSESELSSVGIQIAEFFAANGNPLP